MSFFFFNCPEAFNHFHRNNFHTYPPRFWPVNVAVNSLITRGSAHTLGTEMQEACLSPRGSRRAWAFQSDPLLVSNQCAAVSLLSRRKGECGPNYGINGAMESTCYGNHSDRTTTHPGLTECSLSGWLHCRHQLPGSLPVSIQVCCLFPSCVWHSFHGLSKCRLMCT